MGQKAKKKKNTKKWEVNGKVDSAFRFALKNVLKEAENPTYPIAMRYNFINIAFNNLLEAMALVQTDPVNNNIHTALKLFDHGISKILDSFMTVFHSNPSYYVYPITANKIDMFTKVIDNPYNYVNIDYGKIESCIADVKLWHSSNSVSHCCPSEDDFISEGTFYRTYKYPSICLVQKNVPQQIKYYDIKLMPTNDIVLSVSSIFLETMELIHPEVEKYYIEKRSKYPKGCMMGFLTKLMTNAMNRASGAVEANNEFVTHQCGILYFPEDSFQDIVELVKTMVSTKRLTALNMTGYRLGKNNGLINAIITASRDIPCKIFIELSARGEIQNSLKYIYKLLHEANMENLDIKVRYHAFKVHAKMIQLQLENGIAINVFSTGNYNPNTDQLYKDYHYISVNDEITTVMTNNFNTLWGSFQPVLSSISSTIMREILTETAAGKNGKISIQVNHLDNLLIIKALKEAVRRDCKVNLIVRTTVGFSKKDIPGYKTVVGPYLEHARVFIFGKGRDRRVYISSSDLIYRNLYNRFESYIRIADNEIASGLNSAFNKLYNDGQDK